MSHNEEQSETKSDYNVCCREQEQEEILRARLGRRDSAAQITTISPPTEVRTRGFILFSLKSDRIL